VEVNALATAAPSGVRAASIGSSVLRGTTLRAVESGGRRVSRSGGLLAALSIALLLLLVALASRPESGIPLPPVGDEPGRVAVDIVFYLLLCAGLLGFAVAAWALWPNPDLEMQPIERRRLSLGLAVLAALAVLALVWARNRWGRLLSLPGRQSSPAGSSPGKLLQAGPPVSHGTDWLAISITLLVLVAVAILLWRQVRPERRRPRPARRPWPRLAQVLDDMLEDVLAEEDPRRAVIAAWARMERVLAAHGHARRPAEAPSEYAARAFADLGLAGSALEGFPGLFEWARFSVNEVTPDMREEALGRLLTIREGVKIGA
jgi:hypothetical protein